MLPGSSGRAPGNLYPASAAGGGRRRARKVGGGGEAAEEEDGGRGAQRSQVSGREVHPEDDVCRAAGPVRDRRFGAGHL